jgi:restriction system protein
MGPLPRTNDLVFPLLKVLNRREVLSNEQIRDAIIQELGLTLAQCELPHSGNRTELEYRLAWARTIAKNEGLIESPKRTRWTITLKGQSSLSAYLESLT